MSISNLQKIQVDSFKEMFTYKPSHKKWWWREEAWEKDEEVQIKFVTDFIVRSMEKSYDLAIAEALKLLDDYFEGLILVPFPDKTKKEIVKKLQGLKDGSK